MRNLLLAPSYLLIGSVAAALINFIAIFINLSFYSLEELGVFAINVSIASFLSVLSLLRIDIALTKLNLKKNFWALSLVPIISSCLFMLLILSIYLLFSYSEYKLPEQISLISIVFLVIPIALNQLFLSSIIRLNQLKFSALAKPMLAAMILIFQILFSFSNNKILEIFSNGMILGFFIGNTLFLIFLIFYLRNQVDKFSSKNLIHKIKKILNKLKKIIVHSFLTTLPNQVSISFMPLILSFVGGTTLSGVFLILERTISAPNTLVSDALWKSNHYLFEEKNPKIAISKIKTATIIMLAFLVSFICFIYCVKFFLLNLLPEDFLLIVPFLFFAILSSGFQGLSKVNSYFIHFDKVPLNSFFESFLFLLRTGGIFILFALSFEDYSLKYFYLSSSICYLALLSYWSQNLRNLKLVFPSFLIFIFTLVFFEMVT